MKTCGYVVRLNGTECGDRAKWLIGNEHWPVAVPMCGMHSMRYKEPDGYSRQELDNDPSAGGET